MLWIVLAILTAVIWAAVNVLDKIYLTKWVRQPMVPVIMLTIFGVVSVLIIYFVKGIAKLSSFHLFIALMSGVTWIAMAIFYFKAIQLEEVSRAAPLFYVNIIFVLILATIFLGERFTSLKYLGVLLLGVGAITLSTRSIRIKFNKAFWLMLLASLLVAVSTILMKYLLNFTDYWSAFAYRQIGVGLTAIPILLLFMPELIRTVKQHGTKVLIAMSAAEIGNLTALLLITVALSIGFATLVNALVSVQVIFVFLFSIILSTFYPKILSEKITKPIIVQKIISLALMVAGAVLVA